MIPTTKRDGTPDPAGFGKVREIVEKRVQHARVDLKAAFATDEALSLLCELSGGWDRQLARLLQTSVQLEMPVSVEAVRGAHREFRDLRHLALQRKADKWNSLRTVRQGKRVPEDVGLLEHHYVLEYRDRQGYWYDVNPIIADCEELRP
jgi:hypothetical protein